MQIIWSKSAENDLDSILEYFKDKGEEDVGLKIISQLLDSTSRLDKFPTLEDKAFYLIAENLLSPICRIFFYTEFPHR